MLGRRILDPAQLEAAGLSEVRGMGLLDMETVFDADKVPTQTEADLEPVEGFLAGLTGLHTIRVLAGNSRQSSALGAYCHVECFIPFFSELRDRDIFSNFHAASEFHVHLPEYINLSLDH